MRRSQRRTLAVLAMLGGAVILVWAIWFRGGPAEPDGGKAGSGGGKPTPPATSPAPSTRPAGGDGGAATRPGPTTWPVVSLTAAEALDAYARGLALHRDGKKIEARTVLSRAVLSGRLPAAQEKDAVAKLTALADETLLSRRAFPDDPCTSTYHIQWGERLDDIRDKDGKLVKEGLVRRFDLRVPWMLILRVNDIKDATKIQEGQRLKLVKGPFHVVIHKSAFSMDVYLDREDLPPVFVRRLPVGLGKDDLTPPGKWQVAAGKKLYHDVYWPAANSPNRDKGPIAYGETGYAFGEKGLWIGLAGIDDKTRPLTDYGIHSTNQRDSIGKAESEGCIRLRDEDIEFVWAVLREEQSKVLILE